MFLGLTILGLTFVLIAIETIGDLGAYRHHSAH